MSSKDKPDDTKTFKQRLMALVAAMPESDAQDFYLTLQKKAGEVAKDGQSD